MLNCINFEITMNSNTLPPAKPLPSSGGAPPVIFSDEDLVNLSVKELNKHLRSLSPEVSCVLNPFYHLNFVTFLHQ